MAVVDASYKFIYVDVGGNGRASDGGVFQSCTLRHALEQHLASIPLSSNLRGTDVLMSYHLLGDDAFPLCDYIMKPFPFRNMTPQQRIFNYRLSRCRRTVENAFGIMTSKFRVFLSSIQLQPDKVDKLVLAACVLHNYLRVKWTRII